MRGQRTIPLPELIARLTRPYPPKEAVVQQPVVPVAAGHGRPLAGSNGNARGTRRSGLGDRQAGPFSHPPASRPPRCRTPRSSNAAEIKTALHRDVADALADLGYFFTKFKLNAVPDPQTKTA